MCGITGIYSFNEVGRFNMINLSAATVLLNKRGPDQQGTYIDHFVGLGHCRLSIIDVSENGKQPMKNEDGRYTIVFNGEIYNFLALRKTLEADGESFFSNSDTEVLLKLFIKKGKDCLEDLNGFFAFAIYDKVEKSIFLARDRIGIKPLYYYKDEDKFLFASELKSLLAYGIKKEIDHDSLFQYLQLNYIPGPHSILKGVKKVLPGHFIHIKDGSVNKGTYYKIPFGKEEDNIKGTSYDSQKKQLRTLLHDSVKRRLVADVPVGAFLSGGIDSSIITAIASKYTDHLNTFSIGYEDEPFFDETKYAHLVAKKFNTRHATFNLKNNDLLDHLYDILDYIDEPFADSSAIPVYILSKRTKEIASVALSGDGADELFAGYNKHGAFYKAKNAGFASKAIANLLPLWRVMPKSRNSKLGNTFRQLERFGKGLKLDIKDRYWAWAAFAEKNEVLKVLSKEIKEKLNVVDAEERNHQFLKEIPKDYNINDLLYVDMHLVLVNDMLTKVDLMSMANGLEVRVPFLDHELVKFAFQLPEDSKINNTMKKRILQDAFREELPTELYNRPKHGFEVPLLKWFRNELKILIHEDLLEDNFIQEQGIFDLTEINRLKKQLFSSSPGDVHARIWALVVFQYWWKRHF